jgi:hypothetical protein
MFFFFYPDPVVDFFSLLNHSENDIFFLVPGRMRNAFLVTETQTENLLLPRKTSYCLIVVYHEQLLTAAAVAVARGDGIAIFLSQFIFSFLLTLLVTRVCVEQSHDA